VLADPDEWLLDPWSGELRGDEVWGRGALDMKGQAVAGAVALASLAREGFRPNGDLVLVAAADEEVGVGVGLEWLVRAHPDAVRAEYALNEGGGDRVVAAGRALWLCSTAEKTSSPFRLRVRGRSGHASMPGIADNALVKAARLIERLAEFRPEPALVPETEAFLAAVLGEVPPAAEAVERLAAIDRDAAALLEPLLSLTLSPTMVEASRKRNVIPAVCDVTVDCRLLHGQTQAAAEEVVRAALGEGDYEIVFAEAHGGTRSPAGGPLWEAVRSFVAEGDPEGQVVPHALAGFTDSHWMRDAFGTVAYGFFPMRTMDTALAARLVHSADERIHVDDLELGLEFFRHAALSIGALEST
jgi:acetylornithine deacetylase/succinyl-diaminopimelate desuccinylase-like protein